MPQFVAIPLTGLRDCVRAMRMGFESSLARFILRMTWGGKQWRLYAGLTILYVLTQMVMLVVNNYIDDLWYYDTFISDLLWQVRTMVPNQPIPMLLIVTPIGAGIRQLLKSETYRNHLRMTSNSRANIFMAAIGAYVPFLLFLYFLVDPTVIWLSQFFGDQKPSPWIDALLGFDLKFVIEVEHPISVAWMTLLCVLWFLATLLTFLLMLFPMVYLRSFPMGIAVAAVLSVLSFTWLSLTTMAVYNFSMRHFGSLLMGPWQYRYQLFDRLMDILFYSIFILALGVVWHVAQRRFERGLLPLEEGFE